MTTITQSELNARIENHRECPHVVTTQLGVVCSTHNEFVMLNTENVVQDQRPPSIRRQPKNSRVES